MRKDTTHWLIAQSLRAWSFKSALNCSLTWTANPPNSLIPFLWTTRLIELIPWSDRFIYFTNCLENCLLSNNIMDYYVVSQGKTSIPGVDDGEELELTDVR